MKKLKLTTNNKYYNLNKCFSYNMNINIILGGRGIGKTTTCMIKCLKDFIDNNEEFIYLRRYKTETEKTKKLLSPIIDGIKTKGIGNSCFEYVDKSDKVYGYSISLSVAPAFKSSVFDKVKYIVFDEAILKRGGSYRYLKDEIICLLEFISTVFRTRTDYKIFILGNNLDMFNPYFDFFNIPKFESIYVDKERGIYIELCKDSETLRLDEEKTPLFKLINGTAYGDYHYNNKVLVENNAKIGVKDYNARLMFRLVLNKITLNIYLQHNFELFVEIREDKIIEDSSTFKIFNNGEINYYYVRLFRKSTYYQILTKSYYQDKVTYQNDKSLQVLIEILEYL